MVIPLPCLMNLLQDTSTPVESAHGPQLTVATVALRYAMHHLDNQPSLLKEQNYRIVYRLT